MAYSPLGRGFFGGKGVVESLPTGSLLVCDYELIMRNINFCIMVFWFINLNELDYARNSLQILTPNLEVVLSDYELHIWVNDFLFCRGICILNSDSCSCHRFIIQGSMMRIWIETLLYSKFSNLAAKHAYITPQLALAWLLHQGIDIIPIPGIVISFLHKCHHFDICDWINLVSACLVSSLLCKKKSWSSFVMETILFPLLTYA